jgi:hypothetical protein
MPEPDTTEKVGMTVTPTFTLVKAEDFRSIYSNNVGFQTGPFDFSLTFGEVTEVDQSRQVGTITQRVRVTMSPLHAKLFAILMAAQIKGYQQSFGEIKIPADVLTPQASPEVRSQASESKNRSRAGRARKS